ncbi:MAG TPA: helix-turn-helix domain-containing protein [Candidatus Cybelea sp.]|nr:helix-turn-helix domain-containing protein [Candidatus Cybelea sp.]
MPRKNPQKTGASTTAAAAPTGLTQVHAIPDFMSVDETARRLAVSSKTIRRAIDDRRLVPARLGRRVLISQAAFQQFATTLIMAGQLPPASPPKR